MLISPIRRARIFVSIAASIAVAFVFLAIPLQAQAQDNPVVVENQRPGSSAWQLGDLYGRPFGSDSPGQIKGYASATSVNKGEPITFYVTVSPAQTYTIDIYRMGWYQGLGGRLIQHIGPLSGVQQPACPTNATTGLIVCNWTASHTLATQATWTSGIYLAVLRNAQGFHNYVVFAVRDDSRVADLLFQQSVTTYQANNNYPDNGTTGKSTFENSSYGADTIAGSPRAVKVSFDRPYNGDGVGNLFFAEINLLRWLERNGYDVAYSTNIDTHASPQRLLNYKAFISPPHDEFWSKPMYDGAFAARDAGVNLGFFGANSIYWQVRFEPSAAGVPNRVMVAYKDVLIDPIADPSLETVKWRDGPLNRPEQVLMGIQYTNGPEDGWAPYVVTNSSHWVYEGTGFTNGSTVPGIVGPETDRFVSGYPGAAAVPGTFTLLSRSPYSGSDGSPDYSNSSIYQALSGAWVFASGTMVWSWGLDDFYPEGNVDTVDVRIQRATTNILNRFINSVNLPPTVAASATPLQGARPLSVAFSSTGSSDPEGEPLTYLWQFGDGTTSTAANPTHVYNQNGQYSVTLTVSDGDLSTASAPLTIAVGNRPVPVIVSPANGSLFRGGTAISISGDATDLDQVLPAGAFSWAVDFLHDDHVHPGVPTAGTKNLIFNVPTTGHTFSGNTRYQITLTVTDADGLQATTTAVIFPDKVNLTFDSSPSRLSINLDGVTRITPFVYDTLINFTHTIEAPNQFVVPNAYTFASWSDGGAQQHTITAPATSRTYTASFSGSVLPAPLTYAQSKGGFSDASATSLVVQLTDVKPGSLIVAYVKWEGPAASTVSISDGTSTFVADTLNSAANNDLHGRFFYLLSSTASGTVNYTATWSAARPYRRLLIYEYTYGGTVSFDASNRATAASGTLTAGTITTTGSDELVFGAYGEYNANNTTAERINNVVADHVLRSSFASMWSKSFNAPFTGTATATGNSTTWIGNVIAFKRTFAPAPNTPPTISALAAQTISEDAGTAALAVTVGDAETAPGALTLTAATTNATLVPVANIVFGGSGASRTVTVTPAPNQSGTATITVTVSDSQATAATNFVLTVTAVNDVPTISTLANQTTPMGTAVGPLALTIADVETAPGTLTLTGATSNPALVPVANIVFGGSAAARLVTVTPAPNQSGSATITITVSDGQATAVTSFVLTVTPGNTAPTISALGAQTVSEDTGTGALALTIGDAETAAGSLTLSGATSNPALVPVANIVFGGTGASRTVTVTPAPNQSGSATITVTVSDSQATAVSSFLLTVAAVNDLPTISALAAQTVSEDTGTGALAVTIGDAETAAGSLTLSGATSNPTLVPVANIVFGGTGASRTVTVTPAPNQSGSATITVTVSDSQATALTSFVLTVTAVNDLPTISALGAQTISEDTGTGALALTISDTETAAASLTLSGASTNTTLVPVANIVFGGSGASRTVTVTPAPNQSGNATITVTVSDSQATAVASFLLTVTGVNDLPTISALSNQTTPAGTAIGPLAFTVGDLETAAGSLTLSGASSNPTLVPVANIVFGGSGANRTVTVSPAATQSGSATITVTVSDSAATAVSSFVLTVTPGNTAPTISALAAQTISEDTGTGALALTVGDAETAAGSLTLTGATTNPTLIPVGNIVFGGAGTSRTVTVTPAANQSGTATITVTVSDGQATAVTSFVLTVSAVNDLPTISVLANQTTPEGTAVGPLAFTVGDLETAAGSLTLSGASSNPTLVPVANIVFGGSGASRVVTVTPAPNQSGTATITVTVSDSQGTAASTLLLTVIANTAPTISALGGQIVSEDTGTGALAFTIGDAESAAGSLTLSGASTNPSLVPVANIVFSGTGASRTVTVTPAPNQSGAATITVTVSDSQATAVSSFLLTVAAVNDLPTISTLANQTTPVGAAVGPLAFTVGDIETAAGSLTLSAASNNPTLVPVGNVVFGGSGASRTVTVTPAPAQNGSATITVTVSDSEGTAVTSFLLTVTAVNDQLAFAQSNSAFNNASGTTLTVQLTNVKPGSLIVAYVKWEGTAAATVSLNDGTGTFVADTLNSAANNSLHGRFFYRLASTASGTVTYTATWSAGRTYRKLMIYEYSYGGTLSFDASNRATATSGSLTAGTITTTGSDEIVFGAYGEYNANNTTNERINNVVADRVLRSSFASMWSKSFNAPFTGTATATGNSTTWIGNVIAFKRE